jgi:hypothetical protein
MIIPKFDEKRIASPDSVAAPLEQIVNPQAKSFDEITTRNRKAYNKQVKEKEAERKKGLTSQLKVIKAGNKVSNSGKKPTKTAIKNQNKAADTYVIKSKKALTPEEKERNAAARSYKTTIPASPVKKSKIKGQSEGAAGRPNTNAASKPIKPIKPSTPKTTVNKTGARNVRGATKPPTVASVPNVTKPVGAGRRANGAPKSK